MAANAFTTRERPRFELKGKNLMGSVIKRFVYCAFMIGNLLTGRTGIAAPKPLINYFQPIPIVGQLSKTVWGASIVGARDPSNGIEDPNNYFFWDGKIIKANDGKYHLFCSRWPLSAAFSPGWMTSSTSIHAVSDNPIGPYKYQGPTYTYQNGKGHNTTGLALPDGTYAVIESAIVPGWIFTSSSLDAPFVYQGSISWNGNGFNPQNVTSNTQITIGPDGRFWAIGSSGFVLRSDKLLGTYQATGPSIYPTIAGADNGRAEDPVIWYSGGYYHVVYNYWDIRKSYHLMSVDGIHNWINTGVAVDRSTDFIRYTDGTVNHWGNMERPNVVLENGHVAYFTFAVTDVDKDTDKPAASKVIVVPFDGVSFDADNGGETGGSGGAGTGGSGGTRAGGSGGTGTGGSGVTTGGSRPTGGNSAVGGTPGSGGTANATGGISVTAGGTPATGGAMTMGGTASIFSGGGTNGIASGGTKATGGTAVATGGRSSTGGNAIAASGGSTTDARATNAGNTDANAGCGCRVAAGRANTSWLLACGIIGVIRLRRHKRDANKRLLKHPTQPARQ